MELFQFKIFCAVAEVRSFSQAAKLLHLSQPAISTQIKNLEESFHGQLFERTVHGVTLTEPGQVFYQYARQILELEQEMDHAVRVAFKQDSRQIRLGASTTMGNISLPCAIYMFKEEFPDINIKLEIANTKEIIRKLDTNEVDLGVVEDDVETSGFCCTPIINDELVFIAPPSPSADKSILSLDEFLHQPLILREQGSGTREALEKALGEIDLNVSDLSIVTEMSTLDAIKSAVSAGMGASIVPHLAVRKEEYLKIFRVSQVDGLSMPITYNLLYPAKKMLPFPVKHLVHYLSDPDKRYLC